MIDRDAARLAIIADLGETIREQILRRLRDDSRHLRPGDDLGNGLVAVPREATEAMLEDGHQEIHWHREKEQNTFYLEHPSQTPNGIGTTCKQDMQDAWSAMLAALKKSGGGVG